MPTLGIEKLKQAVSISITLGTELGQIKKANIFTIIGMLADLKQLIEMVKNRKEILAELKDLSPVERTELMEYIKSEFSIPDQALEQYIEDALAWAELTITMVERGKAL